jgi:signal transduction histidine kinase
LNGALAAMAVMKQINPDPNLERPHTVLERQLRQANRLVEDLADVARLAGGEIELRRDDVDVAQQLRDLTPGWEAVAAQTQKSFAHDITPGRVMVWGEAERLQQVFSNLVGNALKYTPPGRGIRISLHTEGEHAVFSVRDEGEGIPADRLSRIFEMFQRATTTGSGLGIGLGVVQALVEAHGGEVTAASEGEGRGATFTVRLPLHRDS